MRGALWIAGYLAAGLAVYLLLCVFANVDDSEPGDGLAPWISAALVSVIWPALVVVLFVVFVLRVFDHALGRIVR